MIQPKSLKRLFVNLCCFFLFACSWVNVAQAQTSSDIRTQIITIGFTNEPLKEALLTLGRVAGFQLVFPESVEGARIVNLTRTERTVEAALNLLLQGSNLEFHVQGNSVVFSEKSVAATTLPSPLAERTFMGRIIDDATGEGLPFATVRVRGTTVGTVSTLDGDFSITAPNNAVLVFSYTGFETLEIPATGPGPMGVRLRMAATTLEHVVITGYQTIVRERVTGAVTSISSGALESRFNQNLMQNLEGRVAGLVIDSEGNATIRGTGSLHAVNRPLLVVDGMPIEGSIEDLNPFDIETVTVLKDAAATAMYGARASAGVIVITTRRARYMGTTVDVSANFTVSQRRNVDYADNFLLTPAQQVSAADAFWFDQFVSSPNAAGNRRTFEQQNLSATGNRPFCPVQFSNFQLGEQLITQRDHVTFLDQLRRNNYAREFSDNILLNRFVQQYNVAIRSRSENFAQNLVLNFRADNGGIILEHDNRFNISYRADYRLANWVSLDFGLNAVVQRADRFHSTFRSPANDPFTEQAFARLLNDDGSFANNSRMENGFHDHHPALRSAHYNALQELRYDRTNIDRTSLRYHAGFNFRISEGITAQLQFVYEDVRALTSSHSQAESHLVRVMRNEFTRIVRDTNQVTGAINERFEYMVPEHGGRLATQNIKEDNWTVRGQINYSRVFANRHNVDFLAGLEFRETLSRGTNGLLLGFDEQLQMTNPMLNFRDLYNWRTNAFFPDRQVTSWTLIDNNMGLVREVFHRFASGYANITYTLDGKYNVFASFRRDFADVYGLESEFRGAPLWSVGLSWVASRENFMRDVRWVDYLKIRGSYGLTGNIHLGTTSVMTATSMATPNRHNQQPQAVVENPGNPFLTWERTTTANIGADFGLFTNRMRGSLDFYYRRGDDVFSHKALESTFGFPTMFMNNAALFNRGVELALSYDWFRVRGRDQFNWTTGITVAYNHNRVTHVDLIANTAQELVGSRFREGFASSAMWAYRFGGLDDIGRQTFFAADGSRISNEEILGRGIDVLVFAGQSEPKITMGIDNTLRYRGFTLNVLAIYWGGHKMRALQAGMYSAPVSWRPMPAWILRGWTPENPDTDVPGVLQHAPAMGGSATASNNADIYVHHADFLKIRNISFGYDIPQNLISRFGMSQATVRFQLDHPPALWKRNNVRVDPETVNDPVLGGVRRPTSFIFGLNIRF
ncbi:MAG: SusC/RagA family TonB-linked outer membrane protein [Bacteroidales bacterium]|nr:SusC/RagA family TonB-linked outer membrane protein [Bacteroidales bacterium]